MAWVMVMIYLEQERLLSLAGLAAHTCPAALCLPSLRCRYGGRRSLRVSGASAPWPTYPFSKDEILPKPLAISPHSHAAMIPRRSTCFCAYHLGPNGMCSRPLLW